MPQTPTSDLPRASRACVRCRVSHLRCRNDGHVPCRGCERVGAECKFLPSRKEKALARNQRSQGTRETLSSGGSVTNDLSRQDSPISLMRQPYGSPPVTIVQNGHFNSVAESRDVIKPLESLYDPQCLSQAIDLFFQHFYADILFSSHEPSIRAAAKSGELNPILAVAILALTARFIPELVDRYGSSQKACDHFADAIRAELLLEADKPSLDKIHALLFLTFHEWGSGRGARAWIYIGACIRSALLLRTFRKQTPLAPPFNKPLETPEELIVEESRIRVFWSMVLMEHFMTTGKHRSFTRYDEHNSIGKPSFEENFLWGTTPNSATEPFWSREPPQLPCSPQSSEKACLAAAVKNWNTVNRWVSFGGAKQESELPWAHGSRFNQLREQLQMWEANLPLKLRYKKTAFAIHDMNNQAGSYGFLHLMHCASVIFLHREYLEFYPDRRKPYTGRLPSHLEFPAHRSSSEPNDTFSSSVPDIFWTNSLHELFTAAHRVTEILTELEALGRFMNTPFVGFAAFTAATMNMYLSIFHWVCPALAPSALERAESDVRYVKRILSVWPLAEQWYTTILRLYDSYKLLHMSERTPETPTGHEIETFHSFDQSLIDYGEIKPGPEEMAAIRRAARASLTQGAALKVSADARDGGAVHTAGRPSGGGHEAGFFIPEEIDWSVDFEQDQYWDDIREEFIGLMTSIG